MMKKIKQCLLVLVLILPVGYAQAFDNEGSFMEYTYAPSNDINIFGFQRGGVSKDILPDVNLTYGYGFEFAALSTVNSFDAGVPLFVGLQMKVPAIPIHLFARANYDILESNPGADLGASYIMGDSELTFKLMSRRETIDLASRTTANYTVLGIAYTEMY